MSTMPPQNDEPEDIDARYRRCSAADPARPADSVRSAVLAQAARLAAERHASMRAPKPWRRPSSLWRGPLLGGLAAATLAGLLVTPHFFDSGSRTTKPAASSAPAPASESAPAPAPQAPQRYLPAPSETAVSSAKSRARLTTPVAPQLSPQAQASKAADDSAPAERRGLSSSNAAAVVDLGAALRRSAQSGDMQGLATLLDGKVDIESRDSAGRTALMLAVLSGRDAIVSALLARGADPNGTDAYDETPLHAALTGNRPQIAAALRQAGAR
jgi:hypothetical protein